MEHWRDDAFETTGYGVEAVHLVREVSELDLIVSVSKRAPDAGLEVSTWDRSSRQRLRSRVPAVDDLAAHSRVWWQVGGFPFISVSGDLVFYVQQDKGARPGRVLSLAPDALEAQVLLSDLPRRGATEQVVISPDGRIVLLASEEDGEMTHRVWCLKTGQVLWARTSEPPAMVHEEHLSFSPNSQLAIMSAETSVQSGSDTVSFVLLEARTGRSILQGFSSVWDEWLQFSPDGKELKLQMGTEYVRRRWPIPQAWQAPQGTPPLAPPCLRDWPPEAT